jgi:polysaccharide biosynthesis transport protein
MANLNNHQSTARKDAEVKMKPEQNVQALSLNSHGKQSEPMVDEEALDESSNQGLNFRPLLKIVRRNILLIIGITAIVSSAALYKGLKEPHGYEGNFQIQVEPISTDANRTDPGAIAQNGGAGGTNNGPDYPTLLQILQSQGMLSNILKQIQTRYPEVGYDTLKENLVIQRVGTNMSDFTKLIEVRYAGSDPAEVQFILQELAKGYLKYSLEDRKTNISGGVQFIEDQLPRLQKQVNTLQSETLTLLQRYNLSDPANDRAEIARQLREVQLRRRETSLLLQEQRKLNTTLQKQLELAPGDVIAASTLSEDPNFRELVVELKRVERQLK